MYKTSYCPGTCAVCVCMLATAQIETSGTKHGHVLEERHDGVPALGRTYLGVVPAADGSSPVRDVDTVRVSQEPVVFFD